MSSPSNITFCTSYYKLYKINFLDMRLFIKVYKIECKDSEKISKIEIRLTVHELQDLLIYVNK